MSEALEIKTERLVLRPYTPDDAEQLAALLDDRDISKWVPTIPFPYTVAHANEFMDRSDAFPKNAAIEYEGKLVGGISTQKELGYWIAPDYRERGFSEEASRPMITAHFDDPDQKFLLSGHLLGNEPSRAILDKLGFAQIGFDEVKSISLGFALDRILMQLTRTAWKASTKKKKKK